MTAFNGIHNITSECERAFITDPLTLIVFTGNIHKNVSTQDGEDCSVSTTA